MPPLSITQLSDGTLLLGISGNFGIRLSTAGAILSAPATLIASDIVALPDMGYLALRNSLVDFGSFVLNAPLAEQSVTLASVSVSSTVATKLDNGTIALAWSVLATGQLFTAVIRADGSFVKSPEAIDTNGQNTQPTIAATREGYAIVYADTEFGQPDLQIKYLNVNGR